MRPSRSRPPCSASRARSATPGTGAAASPTRATRCSACGRSTSARPSSSRGCSRQLADKTDYRTLLDFTKNPRFSGLLTAYTPRGADVIERPVEPDAVRVLIDCRERERRRRRATRSSSASTASARRSSGSSSASTRNSAVVTLITSPDFAIGASVPLRQANGLARPGGDSGTLELDDVPKRYPVQVNDVVSTSGWQDAKENFKSRLPAGIPIGVVTQVNDPGDALVKVIQVTPLVDLDAFSKVLVLTARGASGSRERPPRRSATSSCSCVILPLAVLLQLAVASRPLARRRRPRPRADRRLRHRAGARPGARLHGRLRRGPRARRAGPARARPRRADLLRRRLLPRRGRARSCGRPPPCAACCWSRWRPALVHIAEGGIAWLLGSDGALGRAFGVQLAAAPAATRAAGDPAARAAALVLLGVKAPPRRQFPVPEPLPETDVAATA